MNGSWRMSKTLVYQGASGITDLAESIVTAVDLCKMLSVSTGTHSSGVAGTFFPAFVAARIRQIELWQTFSSTSLDNAAFPANATGVLWEGDGTQFYSGEYRLVQALDETQPGYLSVRPPKGSAASMFLYPSSNTVLRIVNNKYTRVVLHMDFVFYIGGMPNEPGAFAFSSLPSPVNAGQLYPMPLDGVDAARLLPIAVGVPL